MPKRAEPKEHFLAEWRVSMGLTQEELADRAGVSHSTISRVEQGRVKIRSQLLSKLSKALGIARSMILEVNPAHSPAGTAELIRIWDRMEDSRRDQFLEIAKTFARREKAS